MTIFNIFLAYTHRHYRCLLQLVSNHIFSVDSNWGTSQFRPAQRTLDPTVNLQPTIGLLFLEIDSAHSVWLMSLLETHIHQEWSSLRWKTMMSLHSVHDMYCRCLQNHGRNNLTVDHQQATWLLHVWTCWRGIRYWMWMFTWDMVESELWLVDVAQCASNALQHYWRLPCR